MNLSYIDDSGILDTGVERSVEVPLGMTTYTFIVPIINDDIAAQSTRDIVISVATGAGYTPSVDPVTVNVVNDDSAVVSILAVSSTVNEGTSAQFEVQVDATEIETSLTVTINLTAGTGENFGINLDDVNVIIAAGETNAMFTVGTTGDDIDEADSSLTATISSLTLSPVSGVQPEVGATDSATVMILDDDDAVVVSITTLDNTTISEADGEIMLRLNLSRSISQDLQVNLLSTGDSGLVTGVPAFVKVSSNTETHDFAVPINDMIAAQATRTFNVTVDSGDGYAVGDPSDVEINVLNDDTAVVSISPRLTDSIVEGEDAVFEVQVNNAIATSLTARIELTTMGGEFGINLDDPIDVVIVAGETTALLTVVTGGDIDEVDGSLTAEIISLAPLMPISGVQPEISVDNSSATVMIQDDDELLVSITTLDGDPSMTVSESDEVSLRLTLTDAINRDLPVTLSYIDDSGLALNAPTVVNVPEGNTSQDFSILVRDDDIAAQSTRNIVISVATGAGYTPSVDPVTVNVVNDDSAVVSILAVSSTVNEGDPAQFEVQVSTKASVDITAEVEIDLTTVGGDFGINLDDVNVVIAAGKTTAMLTVDTTGDDIDEANGFLTATINLLTLEQVSGVQPEISATDSATVTILDDDDAVVVSITTLDLDNVASTTISEADGEIMLRLSLSRPISQDLQVDLSSTGDSGLATGAPTNVVVSANNTSRSFSILVDDDIAAQATRTFNVLIEPDSSYDVGTSSSVAVSVLNEDSAVVSIFALSDRVDEGDSAEFEVQVSNEIAVSLTVTINLTAGSSEEDFGINLDDVDVEIAAGETTALLTVETTGDDIDEENGSLTATINSLTLEPVSGVQPTSSVNPATVTILDDDDAVVVRITTLENEASTTISEADGEIMLLLKLSRSISQPLQVNLSSVGDPGLAARVPTVVEVSSNTATQDFTVTINDMIVAQPDRNIDISVASGNGYTESATPVTVNVIDDDTATVSILPVRTPITAGEDAEFNVILGLETAVDIEIGIDVGFGGVFIRAEDRRRTTVTVSAGQTRTSLIVPTMENTGMEENSSLVATLSGDTAY